MEQAFWNVIGDIFYGVLIFAVGYLWNERKEEKNDQKAIKKGVLAILRNNLILIHNEAVQKNYLPITQAESAMLMFEAYKELGGNGVIPDMMKDIQRIRKLSIERKA